MGDPPRGRPRAEPREEQRGRIVRTARAAFTERGYDAVTLSGIAKDAAVPRAVVYEVIGSKDRLLAAVTDEVTDELIAAVDERFSKLDASDRPPAEIIGDDVRWYFELIASEPSYAAIIEMSRRLVDESADPGSHARRRFEDRIVRHHLAAVEEGTEREASARALSVAVLAMLESVALRAAEERWPTAAIAKLIGDFATGGYLWVETGGAAQAFEDGTAT